MTEFAHDLEVAFISYFSNKFGLTPAIIIEDICIIILSLMSGYIVGQLNIIRTFAYNKFVVNNRMKSVVYQKNQFGDIVEYDFKRPENFIQVLESLIGIHLARLKISKLELSKARTLAIIAILLLIVLAIAFSICILFALHVVYDGVLQ